MNSRKKRSKRKSKGGFLFLVLLILGVVLAFCAALSNSENITENFETGEHNSQQEKTLATPDTNEKHHDLVLAPAHIENISDTGYLVLLNKENPISIMPDLELLAPAWPTVPVSVRDGMYLHPSALQAVRALFDSAREADIGTFYVSSGFRSYDEQAELYNHDTNGTFVLPPGYSEHHTGLAVDIMAMGVSQWELGNSDQGRWLADNAYRFGLILRYPEGAENITGIAYEPWHFRYVGEVHSYYMRKNNLVFEEYVQLIQSRGSLTFSHGGITYFILHQISENGIIYLPEGLNYMVSNDNSGGYIVTAW
jgi:D-alanyl-D-alanine carboxypeptidase